MRDPHEFEVWREVWEITEWRDDSVYQTMKVGEGWFNMAEVIANMPRETNKQFVIGGENCPEVAIRRAKKEQ